MEYVILVDSDDRAIGRSEKHAAHRGDGKRHRAFSVFLFDAFDQLLLQQRATAKYHFGGLWSNSCCGHPRPGETVMEAARRRTREELGISVPPLRHCFAHSYEATDPGSGLTEREIDHVFVGYLAQGDSTSVRTATEQNSIPFDRDEIENIRWNSISDLQENVAREPGSYTPWLIGILPQLTSFLATEM